MSEVTINDQNTFDWNKVERSMSLDDLELLQVFVGISCCFTDLGGSNS